MAAIRIMVVEDDIDLAEHIARSLKKMGYEIVGTVSTGEEAIERAHADKPDVILMDIVLNSAMDGIEAASHIRRELSIPIVYTTAYDTEDLLHRAKITEPFGYILKPFTDRELRDAVEIAVYKSRMEEDRAVLTHALKSALDQVKTLTGLLPICSSCKKIRDSKGSWKPMEEYITARTSAHFTHGFCPDCIKKFVKEGDGEKPNDR